MRGGGSYGKFILEKSQNYAYKTDFAAERIQYFADFLSANMDIESEVVLVRVTVPSTIPEIDSGEVHQFYEDTMESTTYNSVDTMESTASPIHLDENQTV